MVELPPLSALSYEGNGLIVGNPYAFDWDGGFRLGCVGDAFWQGLRLDRRLKVAGWRVCLGRSRVCGGAGMRRGSLDDGAWRAHIVILVGRIFARRVI